MGSDWRSEVFEVFEESESAHGFIKAIERHISTYNAMLVASDQFQDPKDTYEQLVDIHEQAERLGRLLMRADRQVASFITQGKFLAGNTPSEPVAVRELGKELMYVAWAINEVTGEIRDDPDVKRRGYHRNNSRNMLVMNIRKSYEEYFSEEPVSSNYDFVAILTAILSYLDLPHSRIGRVLGQSEPPS